MLTIKSLYKTLSPKYQPLFLEYKTELKPRYSLTKPHDLLYHIIDRNRELYERNLAEFLQHEDVFKNIPFNKTEDEHTPYWNNEYFPGLDIVSLYCLLKKYNPENYVEVGSGNSTMVARKSIRENGLRSKIISIDPQPRASIDQLADKVVRKRLEDVEDLDLAYWLKAGDILFIDNSHRCLPNSDVTVFFLEILPKLSKGVIVHIHDIYLPYDYPQVMCDRFYSEQYLLGVYLMASQQFEIIAPNFFISEDESLNKILGPLWNDPSMKKVERHGGSFWFRVV